MKETKLIFILLMFFILLNSINSITPFTINAFYGFSNESFIDSTVYKTDSIVLRIKTAIESTCYYGEGSPLIPFDGEYGLTHEIYLENIEEGFHEYYVRCGASTNPVMKINFATSIPIYAIVDVAGEFPLKEGNYKIKLVTSKPSLTAPVLEYSFDNLVYKTIPLTGSSRNWEGNLIISGEIGESVCSFRFKARELSGEEGTKITGDNLFLVDTIKPATLNILDATGYEGQIKLEWFNEEKVKEYYIYRTENSPVEYIDFYKSTNKDYFLDNSVEKGKTYYYKIAAVDEAGNIGDLSREIYATALLNNITQKSGLDPKLVGRVDNQITEINSLLETIEEIKEITELNGGKEKELFQKIKLDKEIESSISELNSLKRDVESYKLQDLSEEELNRKISAGSLRISIIKKKVPEKITIIEEKNINRNLNEENIRKGFLEYFGELTNEYEKNINGLNKGILEEGSKINSEFYSLEIMYLDGTKKVNTLIQENIMFKDSEVQNTAFIMVIPKEIIEKASEIKILNLDFEIVKEDPVILFNPNTQEIIYYLNKELNLESLEGITLTPIKTDLNKMESKITGNAILNGSSKNSFGIIILVVFALILGIYFLKIRNSSSIRPLIRIVEDLKRVKGFIKEGKENEANALYCKIKEEYKLLSEKEKRIIVEEIKDITANIK